MLYVGIGLIILLILAVYFMATRPGMAFMWRLNYDTVKKATEGLIANEEQISNATEIKKMILLTLGESISDASNATEEDGYYLAKDRLIHMDLNQLDRKRKILGKYKLEFRKSGHLTASMALQAAEYAVNAEMLYKSSRDVMDEMLSMGLRHQMLMLLWPSTERSTAKISSAASPSPHL